MTEARQAALALIVKSLWEREVSTEWTIKGHMERLSALLSTLNRCRQP